MELENSIKEMVKKQPITFGGLYLPPTSLKILGIGMAMPASFALPEKKIAAPKYDTLFHYHSLQCWILLLS